MKLYSVNCIGDITNDEMSIVTIHKSLEGAKKVMKSCIDRCKEYNFNDIEAYYIVEIDTDEDSDIIYDYDNIVSSHIIEHEVL